MNTNYRFRYHHILSALVTLVFILSMLANPAGALAASWSQGVTIASSLPTGSNAFAINPAGNEVWVAFALVANFHVTLQAAQRSFGGAWSPLTTIAVVGGTSVYNLSVSLSANDYAAASWSDGGGGYWIVLRSPAGVWQAPVVISRTGAASNLVVKLDAQGNGVAVWSRVTSTASVVETVSWTAAGVFGNVTQLSSSSQGAFGPDLAVNDAGTAVIVWKAAAPLNPNSPAQIASATRPAGGSWGAVQVVSPVLSQVWSPDVALDGSGNATVVWQDSTVGSLYAATLPVGGAWGSSNRIEPSNWYAIGKNSVAADTAGNVTASWVVEDSTGAMFIHTATRPAGGAWGTPTNLGMCLSNGGLLCSTPPVAAARDGSITVVGWTTAVGWGNVPNVAVRLGSGQWVPMQISGSPQITNMVATNNARASAVWQARKRH